jgi:hypothetical protein
MVCLRHLYYGSNGWIPFAGDIVYTEVLGTKYVILGSAKRANDLLVERSAIYSDRKQRLVQEMCVVQC